MSNENADRDAKRKEFDELCQKTMEASRNIVELEAKLLHVRTQLDDKRSPYVDGRFTIKKFYGTYEVSMPKENEDLINLLKKDVKGIQKLLKNFEKSMHNEIKRIYSETVVQAEVAEEIEGPVDGNSEFAEYCRWLKDTVPMDDKEKEKMKQKYRQLRVMEQD